MARPRKQEQLSVTERLDRLEEQAAQIQSALMALVQKGNEEQRQIFEAQAAIREQVAALREQLLGKPPG